MLFSCYFPPEALFTDVVLLFLMLPFLLPLVYPVFLLPEAPLSLEEDNKFDEYFLFVLAILVFCFETVFLGLIDLE